MIGKRQAQRKRPAFGQSVEAEIRQCDQRPGTCQNCENHRVECPGYRDQLDLAFLDETDDVFRKAKSKTGKQNHAYRIHSNQSQEVKSRRWRGEGSDITEPWHGAAITLARSMGLKSSYDDLAVNFFFRNYFVGTNSTENGPNQNAALLKRETHDALPDGIRAVALASLATLLKAPDLMLEARKRYVLAVQQLNDALQNPQKVNKDSTLYATMLLSNFETVAGNSSPSMTAWRNHIFGGSALLKTRGVAQLKTISGTHLFLQAASYMFLPCLKHGVPIPKEIMELRAVVALSVDSENPSWRVWETAVDFTNFMASLADGSLSDDLEKYQKASELDLRFASAFVDVPPTWQYRTYRTNNDPDLVPNGTYHIYSSFIGVQMWNSMRTMRVILGEIMRESFLLGDRLNSDVLSNSEKRAVFERIHDTNRRLQADVISSIPQHLGYIAPTQDQDNGNVLRHKQEFDNLELKFLWTNFDRIPHHAQHNVLNSPPPPLLLRLFGGFLLPWSLFTVGRVEVAPMQTKQWIFKMLNRVGSTFGIGQAFQRAGLAYPRGTPKWPRMGR
ncbi:uncharacterized protein KY384_004248 [Bacidia gigantensis]|uniref:uncharacterized protein n=1 Tax=Bacidia gigantensis TaxID=2732470 RepID=UPI001D04006A|nr:uncharacterized protein KY384_004248 [Bacidia gigantensis]KAG8530891.1 hypothetical protein KY384_004248 [Bacidia gigantensis]